MNYKYTLFAILCTCVIIFLSSIPDLSIMGNGSLSDQIISNLAHIPAYAVLTFLWVYSLTGTNLMKYHYSKLILFVITAILLFAVSDEIHQSFVPGRTASLMDIGLDLAGILFGIGAFKFSGHLISARK
ncbi:MAG: VanZ family protein [Deltaproteobacteria bacterium]|nr:VanZ family protein [Deltaproteobacteria bacterium]